MSAKASGSDANSNGNAQNRSHHDGSSTRAYTTEQKAAVIRVRKCSPTAFYDILGIESEKSTVTDSGIKKAYRKLSLLTHPDKNGYDGADEAFKMVSRAFQILSDPDKKAKFDRFGGDPDSRFGSASGPSASAASNPFAGGFRRAPGGGDPMFQEEISPEELFRQFFGGGFGGGGFGGPFGGGMFDGSPGFVFNMGGGPGIRVHQFGGQRPRRRPAGGNAGDQEQPTAFQAIQQLLPLLLLFIFPILSSLFSSGTSTPSYPLFNIDTPKNPLTQQHTSSRLGVNYFVNPKDVSEYTSRKWKDLDKKVESDLLYRLDGSCQYELQKRQKMLNEAQGFLGFGFDADKYQAAQEMPKPACDRLAKYGYSPSNR